MVLYRLYEYLIYDLSDECANEYFFLQTPWVALAIILCYIYFVKVLGPRLMKNRKAFNIDRIVMVYNTIQIFWNAYMFSYMVTIVRVGLDEEDFSYWCMPLRRNTSTQMATLICEGAILYTYNKFFDLLETIFFILRRKFNQTSYLHLYHHLLMCSMAWIGSKYVPGGNPMMVGILNSGVHVLMYIYYQLALMGYHKWLWWKRHLTVLQILQFTVLFFHNTRVFFLDNCFYSVPLQILATMQTIYMIYLFSNFYAKTYLRTKKTE